jgi:hypothetical protein
MAVQPYVGILPERWIGDSWDYCHYTSRGRRRAALPSRLVAWGLVSYRQKFVDDRECHSLDWPFGPDGDELRSRTSLLHDILFRILIGGSVVSTFAVLSDLLKPKSFAGLFSAAPSVALATLGLAVMTEGKFYAATEARSMIAGAIAFIAYASCIRWLMLRYRLPALAVTLIVLPLWLAVACGFWFTCLR